MSSGERTPTVEVGFFVEEKSAAVLTDRLRLAPRRTFVDLRGSPLARATTIVLLYSRKALVVLFEVFSDPPLRIAETSGGSVFQDECVELFLADPDDPVSYVEIVVNPAGAVYGALVSNPDDDRTTWTLATNCVPEGLEVGVWGEPAGAPPAAWRRWTCRMSLPWHALPGGRPPGAGDVRRGNATRIGRGTTTRFEALSPTGRLAPPDFHVPSRFARFLFEPGLTTASSGPEGRREFPAPPATPSAPRARGGPGRRTSRPRRSVTR
jgi:hypothetical protein